MAELTWTSEIVYDENCGDGQSWVSITPAQGGSSDKPKVTVTKAAKPTDCVYATIIITSSNGEKQIIPVARCIPECDCEAIGFTANTIAVQEATEHTVELGGWTGSNACASDEKNIMVSVDGNVLCNPVVDKATKKIKATVNENPNEGERIGSFKFFAPNSSSSCLEREVKQKGKEITPTRCECDNLVIDEGGSLSFDGNGGTETAKFHLDSDGCIGVFPEISESEGGEGWIHHSTSIEDNKTVLTVTVDPNTTDKERSGGIIFSVNGGECEEISGKFINVSQEEGEPVVDCDCETIIKSSTRRYVSKDGVGENGNTIRSFTPTSGCESKFSLVSAEFVGDNELGGNPELFIDGNYIKIKNVSANATTENIPFTYKVTYKADTTQCSAKEYDEYQKSGDECYYTMDTGEFEVICNKDTNAQELKYLVSNGSRCTDTSEEQSFTIQVGKGDASETLSNVTGRPTGEHKTVKLDNTYTTQNVYVKWENENGDTGDCYANVEQCTHPEPETKIPKLNFEAEILNEYINTIEVSYALYYKETPIESTRVEIIKENGHRCTDEMSSANGTVESSTFEEGELSDYTMHLKIGNIHGWSKDGSCTSSSEKKFEYLWTDSQGIFTRNNEKVINLGSITIVDNEITYWLKAKQQQN